MSQSAVCRAKAAFKKASGVLELTQSHLQWTQDSKPAPSIRIPRAEFASLSVSKAGSAQIKLKVSLVGNEAGQTFTFLSSPPVAVTEREQFKEKISNIISHNRSLPNGGTAPHPPPIPIPDTPPSSSAPTPRPATTAPATAKPSPLSRAASLSSNRASPAPPDNDPLADFRLRKKVLIANPELATLHRDLVIGGQITESEFWEGREYLLLAEAAAESQKRGRPGTLVDPRPEQVEGGEVKIVITPQLVHDIFEEFPVVAKAYDENVPKKLSEAQFWHRYFQSKLFNAHRASARSSATQHVVTDDPIFDKYLEKEDNELEPRRQRDDHLDLFININATHEDHEETGNEKDITMQAGRQKGVLPLIRKFNEHSERLLKTAMGEEPAAKRRRTDAGPSESDYSQIDLSDLHDAQDTTGIVLEMQDRQRYFEGGLPSNKAAEQVGKQNVDVQAALQEVKDGLRGWSSTLGQLKLERKTGDAAVLAMTQNVTARLDIKMRKNDIPETLFRQMTTCQTAANEFLRQFWSAIYPPAADLPTVAQPTPAQKAAKAAKMVGYLTKTHEKVEALVRAAQSEGVDPSRVDIAMKPIMDAVDKALVFYDEYRLRKLPVTPRAG